MALAILATITLTGCKGAGRNGLDPWTGPTDPMWKVVEDVNANNSKIKTVWARHDFEALIYDQKGKSHALSGNGTLLLMKPDGLLLKAGGIIDFFEVGSNSEQYWFSVFPKEVSTQWWGNKAEFSEEAAAQIPIRPDLLLEVLGVHEISDDFMRAPIPMMRFNSDSRSYMMVWSVPVTRPGPARWAASKEVWFDVETKKPKLVLLFDANGRVVLRAYLTDHKEIQGTGQAKPPTMATKYDLLFPENKSQLSFRITQLQETLKKGTRPFPNAGSFAFPEEPPVEKRIQIK